MVPALVLISLWVVLTAWILACLLAPAEPGAAAAADPYAADVAQFNQELADWDRHGRP